MPEPLTMAGLARSVAIAIVIVLIARRARALSIAGAVAAGIVGTLALLAGSRWGVLLILYFASSSAMSKLGGTEKNARTASIIEKGGERDAMQVLANGGVFALAAALALVAPAYETRWIALGVGALAASASDTWATEIGTLAGGTPRSILGFEPVAPGMSGGVTMTGTLAALAGAAFIAIMAMLLDWPGRIAVAAFAGGIVGSTLDSILGATLQLRRYCDRCECDTERPIHDCGATTRRARGFAWLGNDAVNFISGAAGGLLALAMSG